MPRGGKRPGAGRKKLPKDKRKTQVNFYLLPSDAKKVRAFVKSLRSLSEKSD